MDYVSLTDELKKNKLYLFSLQDIKNLFPDENLKTLKNNLISWISKGRFIRLRRDLYEFIDAGRQFDSSELYVANRLYEPSYVSLETALSIYSIIPDVAAVVTSVTTRPTRTFRNKYGSFFYRSCQKKAFIGYRVMLYEGFRVYIADREKALIDFLYYRLRLGHFLDFDEERLNKKILKKMDWKKAFRYSRLFNNRTVEATKECKRYAKC